MSDLIFYLIPGIIITAVSPVMFFVKMNYFVGFRTTDTLSDPKVWEKSNKFAGLVFLIAGIFLILFTFISYFLRFNWWFKYYLLFFS